jgi:hypothetical protein
MKHYVCALYAFHWFYFVRGFSFIRSDLQSIVRTNAIISSLADNMKVGMIGDKLVTDLVHIHIGQIDAVYAGVFGAFLISQYMIYKNMNMVFLKFSNITTYEKTRKLMNHILYILYFVFIRDMDNAI